MAMSRIVPQSLHRLARLRPTTALLSHQRHRSSKTHHAHIIKVDLDPSSSSQPDSPEATAEVVTLGIQKLEEAIQRIIVHRSAPSWLPFLPGYSYWVPPRASSMHGHSAGSLMEVIGRLAAPGNAMNLRGSGNDSSFEDERMSYSSRKGWPSSAFFIEGTSPIHPVTLAEVELKVRDNEKDADDTPNNEDEQ